MNGTPDMTSGRPLKSQTSQMCSNGVHTGAAQATTFVRQIQQVKVAQNSYPEYGSEVLCLDILLHYILSCLFRG